MADKTDREKIVRGSTPSQTSADEEIVKNVLNAQFGTTDLDWVDSCPKGELGKEDVIRCIKFAITETRKADNATVRSALEKALPCVNASAHDAFTGKDIPKKDYEKVFGKETAEIYNHRCTEKEPCPNCRKRKAVMDGIEKVGK